VKIEPSEIIRRAIERKQNNLSKIKTFSGKLYSKLSMELGGSISNQFLQMGAAFLFPVNW
jgi:flagellin-specific chaperone FliS